MRKSAFVGVYQLLNMCVCVCVCLFVCVCARARACVCVCVCVYVVVHCRVERGFQQHFREVELS